MRLPALGCRPLLLSLAVVGAATSPLRGQAAPGGIAGTYTGEYTCGTVRSGAEISFWTEGAWIKAIFTFYPVGGDPSHPIGAYELSGTRTPGADGFMLQPIQWIGKAPEGWTSLPIRILLNRERPFNAWLTDRQCDPMPLREDRAASVRAEAAIAARRAERDAAPRGFFRASDENGRCTALLKWMGRLESEYTSNVPTNMRHVTNLFGDMDFVPVFEKPYKELSSGARDEVFKAMTACGTRPEMRSRFGYAQYALIHPFNRRSDRTTDGRSWMIPAVDRLEALRADWSRQMASLRTLPRDQAGLRSAVERRHSVGAAFTALWPSEVTALEAAADTEAAVIAEALLAARVDSVLASAAGTDGITSLHRYLHQDLAGDRVQFAKRVIADAGRLLPQSRAASILAMLPGARLELALARDSAITVQSGRIADRIGALGAAAMASERTALERLGPGLAGLEQGATWFQGFAIRYFAIMDDAAVTAVLQDLGTRRAAAVEAAAPELRRRLRDAATLRDATMVTYQFLIRPADSRHPAGARLLAYADSVAGVRAVAEEAERRAEATRRREAASICSQIPGGASGAGNSAEPSARDMCLAVRAQLEALDAGLTAVGAACAELDANADPFGAVACMYANGGSAGTFTFMWTLTRFEKRSCGPTTAADVYRCEYLVGMRSDNLATGRVLNPILALQGPQVVVKRFARGSGGWVAR